MTYATRTDLENLMGADDVALRESVLPGGALDAALVGADAMIDGYLAGRYTLPLTAVPPSLNLHACNIARYMLARMPTDEMRKRFDDSKAWLAKVGSGDFSLGIDGSDHTPDQSGGVAFSAERRVFTREKLDDYLDPRGGSQRR